ncbi:Asp23/Gls24 family envelope stress response protein [Nocardia takedensis]|uniref:Asp23/Gls24 family envelope stress response protein n=1 Tax=Nocardia takedensis TaxID=259390 RepID=UPI000300AB99|nr:Asp23/Gls24 family envelope stress response protein [Nocardia takedensis]
MTAIAEAALPGRTTLAPRVVRRIAEQAAREVDGVAGAVDADAEISGDRTSLAVRLGVTYPRPVTAVTEACRAHLVRRTGELTGLTVAAVDIVVTELSSANTDGRRVR